MELNVLLIVGLINIVYILFIKSLNSKAILRSISNIKKARHPVGLFRIWLLDMTPVVSHDPDA